ncbi:major facilitator superfamily domain-containing protein YCR023C [Diutina catenulata]
MPSAWSKQLDGFPLWQMTVISLIRFTEPIAFTSLFPYVYFMIRDFRIAPTESQISKYSGYLAASFSLCQFIFAVRWGKLADRIGRKWVLLLGQLGTSVALLLFGFSTNFWMALASRSLMGCLNGNIAVLRTMVGEVATEKRHQPLAFSTLPLFYNLGAVLGPMIGGYFTSPSKHNPYRDEPELFGLRQKYPYALSNIVVSVFLWFSMIIGFLFLEESHVFYKNRRDYGLELGDVILRALGYHPPRRPWEPAPEVETPSEESPLLDDADEVGSNDSIDSYHPEHERGEELAEHIVRTYSEGGEDGAPGGEFAEPHEEPQQEGGEESTGRGTYNVDYSGAFTQRVITVISANALMSVHGIVYNEFLPVFLAGHFDKSKLKFPFVITGGLSWQVHDIGTLLSSTGISGIFIILLVFPVINDRLGTIRSFRLSVSFFPFVYFLVPLAIFTLHEYNPIFPRWFAAVYLYTLTSLKTLASSTGMPQINMLNHRAAAPEHRAYVNASTTSVLALSRCIAPVVFGWLMSVGDKYDSGWLIWWTLSAISVFGWIQSYWIYDYDD